MDVCVRRPWSARMCRRVSWMAVFIVHARPEPIIFLPRAQASIPAQYSSEYVLLLQTVIMWNMHITVAAARIQTRFWTRAGLGSHLLPASSHHSSPSLLLHIFLFLFCLRLSFLRLHSWNGSAICSVCASSLWGPQLASTAGLVYGSVLIVLCKQQHAHIILLHGWNSVLHNQSWPEWSADLLVPCKTHHHDVIKQANLTDLFGPGFLIHAWLRGWCNLWPLSIHVEALQVV